MSIKVSVIIPIYNAKQYLADCLESVLQQTLKEIEIICVDDGSTDESTSILDSFAKQDERIVILKQNNCGAGIARNKALECARGEYVAFMDSDDSYPENKTLEHMYQKAIEQGALIVGGYSNILRKDYEGPNKENPLVSICESNPKGTFVDYKDYQFDFNYQAFLYNRKLLAENKIVFPAYRRFQDPPFFVQAMICAEKFFVIPECTYCYKYGHQNILWNAEKINDMVCGHIDNLIISKNRELKKLHVTTSSRLEFRYKDLFVNQLNFDNLSLYALCAYADKNVDFSFVEEIKKRKRKVNRLYLMEALDEKLAKILCQEKNQDCFINKLEEMIQSLIREYAKIDKENENNIAKYLVCILGNLLKENRPFFVRKGVFEFQETDCYQWIRKQVSNLEHSNSEIEYSVNKLDAMKGAFAFVDKLKQSNEDRCCRCVYEAKLEFVPKVSVIIPVYHVEEYLRDCLDSVVNQTLKEIEIICVDDESPDNCYDILMEYAKDYQNITVLRQRNGGLSVARNSGMKYAHGKYIHFLDSDDCMKTDAFERLFCYAENNQLDLLFFDGESFYESEDLKKAYPWYLTGYTTNELDLPICNSGEEYFRNAVLSDNFRMHAGMYITRRKCVEENQLEFINGIIHEDNYYTIKNTLLAGRTGLLQEPFYLRRVRRGSLTIVPLEFRHVYGYYVSYVKLYEFYEQRNDPKATNDEVWLKLRQIIHNGMASYLRIEDPCQKFFYLALPTREMIMFYELFVDSQRLVFDMKEQLNETKQILQRTYDEKYERGIEIKQLKQKIQGIKKSRTYRLARILGFPVRLFRKQKKKMCSLNSETM